LKNTKTFEIFLEQNEQAITSLRGEVIKILTKPVLTGVNNRGICMCKKGIFFKVLYVDPLVNFIK
jgi:hypothetical protein